MKQLSVYHLILLALASEASLAVNDPMKPIDYQTPQTQKVHASKAKASLKAKDFEVNAIIITQHDTYAIINGVRVSKGDAIQSAQVSKILPNYVVLKNRKETLTLYIVKTVKSHNSVGEEP